MKIGILTLPLHTNYGGILQAYALQTTLERMGHEVCVLDRFPVKHKLKLWKAPLIYAKRTIKKYLLKKECTIFIEQKINNEEIVVRQYTDRFINQYLRINKYNDLKLLPINSYDALIVGSDQVWRPKYFPNIEQAYLAFAKEWNIKRIAYAPSFGSDAWEYTEKETKLCKNLLNSFDVVTVRESSGVELCKQRFNITAKQVLDPTLLLERADYEQLVAKFSTSPSKGELLVYVLDRTKQLDSEIEKIADKNGIKAFYTGSKVEDYHASTNERIQPSVEHWIRGFMDANLIITDSFHACVFSIIFNKPFIALGNKERGMSRFNSLLSLFDLEDRLVTSLSKVDALSPIDWKKVNKRHKELKEQCKNLLAEYL